MKFTTKRLLLTPLSDEELEAKMDREQDEHMKKAYGEMLAGCREQPAQRLFSTAWNISDKKTGEVVGDLCFKGGPDEFGVVELGYGIDEAHRGKGYATEAAGYAMEWAFGQEGVYYVAAESEATNAASLRVIEKLGMQPAGMGEEGPRFEKEKPLTYWMGIYMCLGMSVGVALGSSMDSMGTGLSLGVAIGMALGAALDASAKKKRAEIRAKRNLPDTEDTE